MVVNETTVREEDSARRRERGGRPKDPYEDSSTPAVQIPVGGYQIFGAMFAHQQAAQVGIFQDLYLEFSSLLSNPQNSQEVCRTRRNWDVECC